MSSGPKNVTSTTLSEPPAFLRPLLTNVASTIGGDLSQLRSPGAGPQPGQGLIPTGQNLLQQTLQGDFLSPDTNPFLAGTFNRAADLTQNRLASEFAGAGRDLGASLPARSEELQTLASNIFGGNFARERGLQTAALDQAQTFDPLNRIINQLAGIIPGAGGSTQSTQPVFRTGLF